MRNGASGEILNMIQKAGFKIVALKMKQMSKADAEQFYEIHKGKPFYDELITFMSSGQCMVLALEKENAVEEWRNTIGSTNPDEAAERVYNFLHCLTIECQMMARACGKTNVHSLEPEDLAALTMEASALAQVPLAGSQHTVGRPDMHRY